MNPDNSLCILNVDDDAMMRHLAEDLLGGSFRILTAKSGEECLTLLEETPVDVLLLDVEMPGIDGYETCRRVRANSDWGAIPVIFLSAHDAIEDRLRGYEAGGDDYLVKPLPPHPAELKAKVNALHQLYKERSQLKETADYASRTAMTAMINLGELGAVIETMKRFTACNTLVALADTMLEGLTLYELRGAVQIRTTDETLTRTETGEASPLVVSVIKHMATMDRITTFQSRMSINHDYLTLLVNNLPKDDPERRGRLRDHLAMMAEGANVRIQAIILGNTLNRTIENLTETLAGIDAAQRHSRLAINLRLDTLNDDIDRAFSTLGLTETQEQFLSQIVRTGINDILTAGSAGFDVQDRLSALIQELKNKAIS